MKKANRHRFLAQFARVLVLVSLFLTACEYQTLGNLSGTNSPSQAASGAKAGQGAKAVAKATATEANPILCRLADLTPTASWNVTEQGLSGSLTLTNYWPVTCTLRGEPKLGLTDDNGMDFYVQVTGPTPSPTRPSWKVKENTVAEVRFTWSNWCGLAPSGSMKVTVALSGQVEPALFVPVEDQNGNPLYNTPPCVDKNQPSTLAVEGLKLLN
jgi:hypothetical protein